MAGDRHVLTRAVYAVCAVVSAVGLVVIFHGAFQSGPDPVTVALGASECDRTRAPLSVGGREKTPMYVCRMPDGRWRCIIRQGYQLTDVTRTLRVFLGPLERGLGNHEIACL